MFKRGIKNFLTYFFNGSKILKFKKFGKGSFTCPRCKIIIGNNVCFGNDLRLSCYSADQKETCIEIQDGVYGVSNISILTASKVTIEENVLLASYINILGENHSINPESEKKYGCQPLISFPISIKRGAWIGQNVTILTKKNGLVIGERSIVGAGSVVTKDVPDYCIAVGNPAKIIKRYNFEKHEWESIAE